MDYSYSSSSANALPQHFSYDLSDAKSRRALCLLLVRLSNRIRSQICDHSSWDSDLKILDQVDIIALWNQAPGRGIVVPEINSSLCGDILRKYWEDLTSTEIIDHATLEDYIWKKFLDNEQVLTESGVYTILVRQLRRDLIRDQKNVEGLYPYLLTSVNTGACTPDFFSQAWTIIKNYLTDPTTEEVYRPLLVDFWKSYENLESDWVKRHELLYQALINYYSITSSSNFQALYGAVIEVFNTSLIRYL